MKTLFALSVFLALPLLADAACLGGRIAARRAARHQVTVVETAPKKMPDAMDPKAKAPKVVAAPVQVQYTTIQRTVVRGRLLGGGCVGGSCR